MLGIQRYDEEQHVRRPDRSASTSHETESCSLWSLTMALRWRFLLHSLSMLSVDPLEVKEERSEHGRSRRCTKKREPRKESFLVHQFRRPEHRWKPIQEHHSVLTSYSEHFATFQSRSMRVGDVVGIPWSHRGGIACFSKRGCPLENRPSFLGVIWQTIHDS